MLRLRVLLLLLVLSSVVRAIHRHFHAADLSLHVSLQ